nr:hypothetical protein [Psychrobacter coccoides]
MFIPNVFSDLNDGGSHIVQVEVDIEAVRQQLTNHEKPKATEAKKPAAKKQARKPAKKENPIASEVELDTIRKSAVDELAALDDTELSEIFKAYMNDGQAPEQISLENL